MASAFGSGSGNSAFRPSPTFGRRRITAKSRAESKGLDLPSLDDIANAGKGALDFTFDTLAAPQRNIFSLLSGDGLVDPYGDEAHKYDPSNVLNVGNRKGDSLLEKVAGIGLDIGLDPLTFIGGGATRVASGGLDLASGAARAADDVKAINVSRALTAPKADIRHGQYVIDVGENLARHNKLMLHSGRGLADVDATKIRPTILGRPVGRGITIKDSTIRGIGDSVATSKLGRGYAKAEATRTGRLATAPIRLPGQAGKKVASVASRTFRSGHGLVRAVHETQLMGRALANARGEEQIRRFDDLLRTVRNDDLERINRVIPFVQHYGTDLARSADEHVANAGAAASRAAQLRRTAAELDSRGMADSATKTREEAADLELRAQQNAAMAERLRTADGEYRRLSREAHEVLDYSRTEAEKMFDVETHHGVLDEDQFIQDYLPLVYNQEGRSFPRDYRWNDDPFFTRERRGVPDAIDGFDFAQSMRRRIQAHNTALYNKQVLDNLTQLFGHSTDEIASYGRAAQGFRQLEGRAARLTGGAYFPRSVADSIERLNHAFNDPDGFGEIKELFSQGTRLWKNAAYTINPGHLTGDAIGNTFNLWLQNAPAMMSPRAGTHVKIAQELTRHHLNPRGEFRGLSSRANRGGRMSNRTYKLGGHEYTTRELEEAATAHRVMDAGFAAADLGQARRGPIHYAQRAGNTNDNLTRLWGFVAYLDHMGRKGLSKDEALIAAGRDVRRATFDYGDLTPAEQHRFRNIVPFYTWTRKNLPYQLSKLAEAPGLVRAPYEVQENLQQDVENPQFLPNFVREKQFVLPREIVEHLPGANTDVGRAIYSIDPKLPAFDLTNFQGPDALRDGLGMVNPILATPVELATGQKLGNGMPIEDDMGRFALRQFGGQAGTNLANMTDPRRSDFNRWAGLTAMFTGNRVRENDLDKGETSLNIEYANALRKAYRRLRGSGQLESAEEIRRMNRARPTFGARGGAF
jgi:PAS domain-containing protein